MLLYQSITWIHAIHKGTDTNQIEIRRGTAVKTRSLMPLEKRNSLTTTNDQNKVHKNLKLKDVDC